MSAQDHQPDRGALCPSCGRPVQQKFRPFCSARCKDADLGRWFTESYRLPGPPLEAEEDEFPLNG